MTKVGDLTPEERRRRLAELRARQQSNLRTFQQVKGAQEAIRDVTVPVTEQMELAKDRALSGRDLGPLPLLFKSFAVPPPEILDRREEKALRTGAWSRADPGADLSRDIEGALARGGREIVAGDQRLVVSRDPSATAQATRIEAPPLWEHAKALATGQPSQASGIGLLFNALDAAARGSATALNYAANADDKTRIANLPGDVLGAMLGTEGSSGSVGAGGMVAKRGSGMGDYLRKQVMDAKAGKTRIPSAGDRPTLRDFWKSSNWLSPSGLGDKVIESFWKYGYLPAKWGVSVAGDAARERLAKLQGIDPSFVEKNPRPGVRDELQRLQRRYMDRPLDEVDVNDPVFDEVGSALAMLTDPLSYVAPTKAGATVLSKLGRPGKALARGLEVDITKALSKEGRLARALKGAEGVEDARHIAEQVNAVERGAGAQVAMETNEQVKLLMKAADAQRKADVPLVKKLMQHGPNMLRSRQPQEIMADIIRAPRAGLSTSETRAIDLAITGNPRELFLERFNLAQKLNIPISHPHPWMQGTKAQRRAVAAAQLLDMQRARELAMGQRIGKLSPRLLTPEGNVARPPRADVPMAMERAGVPKPVVAAIERFGAPFFKKPGYDPYKRRTMAAMNDLQSIRNEAADLIRQGAIQNPQEVAALKRFIYDKSAQTPQNRQWARQLVLQRGGPNIERPLGTVEEANRIATERAKRFGSTGGQVGFVEDPIQAAMARRQATGSTELFHHMAEGVKGVKDLAGNTIAQPLAEFLSRPRKGIVPSEVTRDLQRFARGQGPRDLTEAVLGSAGIQASLERALDAHGLVIVGGAKHGALSKFMPTLNGHVMPRAVYDDLLELTPKLDQRMLGRVGTVLAKGASAFVPILLNTPGFHVRNTFFGLFQAYLATRAQDMVNPRLWNLASRVAHLAEKGGLVKGTVTIGGRQVRMADLVDEARKLGVFEGGRLADLEGAWRGGVAPYKGQGMTKLLQGANPFNMRRGAFGLTKEPLAKIIAGRGLGFALGGGGTATAENVLRTFVYLASRKRGWSAAKSSGQVMKFMFDYTGMNLTRLEKTIRQWVPFYQWIKQSSLLTIDQVLRQPGKYAGWNRIYQLLNIAGQDRNMDPRYIPRQVLRMGAINSPFSEDTAEQRRMLRLERPGTQITNPDEILSQLHPGAQTAIELGTGRYLFGDTPISRGANEGNMPSWWPLPNVNPEDLAQYTAGKMGAPGYIAQMLLAQINPEWQRTNARHTGVDDRDRMMNRAISTMLGPSPVQVDPAAMRRRAYQDVAQQGEDAHTREQELAKRRAKGRPFGLSDAEVLP